MYLEKILTEDTIMYILIIIVISFALLFLKAKIDCIKKNKQLKLQCAELEKQSRQLDNLTALYNHVLEYDKRKTEFFTSMTHELKTPISVILGAVQLISLKSGFSQEDNPYFTKNMKTVRNNCFRLLRLVNNILDFARADAGYMKFDPTNCNIVNAVEEIVQSVLPYAQQKQILLEFDKKAEEIITAVDLEKLERIMLNLLSNAIKFTPSGGKVTTAIKSIASNVIISVKDTGIGIPLEKQNEIFEKFAQVGSTISREQEGSGIGLWLVKSFVELHGGSISLISEQEKGSEFNIILPLKTTPDGNTRKIEQSFHKDSLLQAADMEFTTTGM